MTKEERLELWRYFRLSDFRDDNSIDLDEYDELNHIISKNPYAKELEDLRVKAIMGQIPEADYKKREDAIIDQLREEARIAGNEPESKTKKSGFFQKRK